MKKFIKSLGFALEGVRQFFFRERNARIQIVIALIAIILGFWLKISSVEWLVLLFFITLVLALEMINSAIEKLCDLVSIDFHPTIKKIKDIAAGAVLLASVFSLIAGIIIFIPRIYQLLIPGK